MAEIKAPALSPKALQGAEYVRFVHAATIPPGIPLGSVTRPDFWAHCCERLKQYDLIECRAADNKWEATLRVASIGSQAVTVWVVNYVDIAAQMSAAAKDEDAGEYTVSFTPRQRWRVIRKSDGVVVSKDHATEDDANAWVKSTAAA